MDRHVFVVLGATGDLFSRKLLPAIHSLVTRADLDIHVLGAATTDLTDEDFRRLGRDALTDAGLEPAQASEWCDNRLHYCPIPTAGDYQPLARRVTEIETAAELPGNRVFYMALPPQVFPIATRQLAAAGLNRSDGWTRLVIEKPFGRDLDSARELNEVVHADFDESQVYRIDHYLGKETVQNLLVFRFANPIFEASWNRDRIDRVEITVAESLDVGDRGDYYDTAGVVRDMIQSHLTQVMSLVGMETPVSLTADAIRDEKVKVLRSIAAVDRSRIVLGQYDEGTIDGSAVTGYRHASDVDPSSETATFAAVRLDVDTWRWQGVPFYLRTGKAMAERTTQVAVTFSEPPVCLFHGQRDDCTSHPDVLYLTLQPDEGFSLEIEVKEPGTTGRLRTIPLSFSYSQAFGEIPDAYETLLADIIQGDQTLFERSDEVEEAWRIFGEVLDPFGPPNTYAAGSWGPIEARDLLDSTNWATGPQ